MQQLITEYKRLIKEYLTEYKGDDKKYNFLRGFSHALRLQGFTSEEEDKIIAEVHEELAQEEQKK